MPDDLTLEFFEDLAKMLRTLGYNHLIAFDERCGYRFVKEIKDAKQEHHNSGDNYSCYPLSTREDS